MKLRIAIAAVCLLCGDFVWAHDPEAIEVKIAAKGVTLALLLPHKSLRACVTAA
jgi:hypothetical protein